MNVPGAYNLLKWVARSGAVASEAAAPEHGGESFRLDTTGSERRPRSCLWRWPPLSGFADCQKWPLMEPQSWKAIRAKKLWYPVGLDNYLKVRVFMSFSATLYAQVFAV